MHTLKRIWACIRQLSGDDAYERYLAHWHIHHAAEGGEPLSRRAFFKAEQERKWNGVRRCC
ncbi:MAG: YbdD/YjiX family protein [Thiohalobacteraceae bacterium]|nr:YbdD/YjiX family protein [Gammaproteobacteria bacterium]